jgi:prepilin-type N-terminal cleavage/methylation domain-containing protein
MLKERSHTLIEIIVVLVILSILAATAVPRMIDVEKNANQKAIQTIIPELNSRERCKCLNIPVSVRSSELIF